MSDTDYPGLVDATVAYVQRRMSANACGHDWWHIERVRRLAMDLATTESCDRRVVELAALLHDVGDWKFHGGDETVGPRMAREWLLSCGASIDLAEKVAQVIAAVSFKGAGVKDDVPTIEAAIVQDADRLDAIGAIGIARAFAYGGSRGRPIHTPGRPATPHDSAEAYKNASGTTLNHFHEKLLLLKDRLHTAAAKKIAADRHAFMLKFLDQFEREWQ